MAKRIAVVTGTALVPGVSKNGRYYSPEAVARAVARAQQRIDSGGMLITDRQQPLSQRTHHAAEDDSTAIVGRLTSLALAEDGSAKFTADIADTPKGRTIAALADTSDGRPAFLRGVSIRGAWADKPRTETIDGKSVQTADDLILDGLDYTGSPGVAGAVIDSCVPVSESVDNRDALIYESVLEATVTADADESAPEAPAPTVSSVPTLADLILESGLTAHHLHAELGVPLLQDEHGASLGALDTLKAALTEAKTPLSKRGSGLTGTGGPYADPGYQPDKKQRYQLGTKAEAKAAWSYVHQKDNAAQYTANQLKRIKQRIVKALKKFGVEVNTAERYLIDRLGVVTESAALAEHYLDADSEYGAMAGSFCISLSNGPVNITISSYRVDPADLDLIGRAAMDGACRALATIDPDMDGDIDVPGVEPEDTDDDAPVSEVPGMPCPCGCGCAVPLEPGDCPCGCLCTVCGDGEDPMGESAPDTQESTPDPAAPAADPAPEPAADPTTETEEPAVSEPTTAVEPTQAAPVPAAPGTITLTDEQFAQLLARHTPAPAETAAPAAAPVAESAPVAPAVTETQEQMIARLVQDGITRGVQKLVSTGALAPGRKGLVARPVTETGEEAELTEFGVPEDWPQKPLHKYTAEENRKYTDRALAEHVLGNALYTGRRSG